MAAAWSRPRLLAYHRYLFGRTEACHIFPLMDAISWQKESLDWANYVYVKLYQHLLAPRLAVKGRMATIILLAVIWASAWYVCDRAVAAGS